MSDHQEKPRRSLITIVGGGAAGLAAAIAAAERLSRYTKTEMNEIRSRYHFDFDCPVTILEKNDRVGRKLLATGNGRCNLSHQDISFKSYHGHHAAFAKHALQFMDTAKTIDWFSQIGVPVRTESDGRIFPNSLQAASVLDNLRFEADRLRVKTVTQFNVIKISPGQPLFIGSQALEASPGFDILAEDGRMLKSELVIVTGGGMAGPAFGCDGSAYSLMEQMGHTMTPVFPALVQIKTGTGWSGGLAGSKVEGEVSFFQGGERRRSEQGEILFTRYGLSGPPVLQLSRLAAAAEHHQLRDAWIELNFLPQWHDDQLSLWLKRRADHSPDLPLSDYLTGLLPKKIGQALLKQSLHQPLSQTCGLLDQKQIDTIVHSLLHTRLPVCGTLGWDQAQVTAGGLDVNQFNPATLESSLQSGLFAAGEIFDIDGDCGGFNLQWAWSSGHLAGVKAAERTMQADGHAGRVDFPVLSQEAGSEQKTKVTLESKGGKLNRSKPARKTRKAGRKPSVKHPSAAGKVHHKKPDHQPGRQQP